MPGQVVISGLSIISETSKANMMDNQTKKLSAGTGLFLASFLSLFLELALIRWIPGTVHAVAFFNNLVLIACFLGLGIGMTRQAPLEQVSHSALWRFAIIIIAFGLLALLQPTVSFGPGSDYATNEGSFTSLVQLPITLVIVGVFILSVWASVPFGQLVAIFFDRLERIPAYSINVAGSLLGVLVFAACSWFATPPALWFLLCIISLFLLNPGIRDFRPILLIVGVLIILYGIDSKQFRASVRWSPYYKVRTSSVMPDSKDLSKGFVISVNNQFLLSGFDMRAGAQPPEGVPEFTRQAISMLKSYYNFPFERRQAKDVLVLGSGAGNDVAAALRHKVNTVTAVEIDPLVLHYGRNFHPEKPYLSSKVTIVNDDARAFLNQTKRKFDLIIFATLDAHGLISSMGSVRLDSFVYTRESIAAARDRLTKDGIMVLSFGPFREDVQYRQYANVRSVFNREPLYLVHENQHRSIIAGATDSFPVDNLPQEWKLIDAETIEQKFQEYPTATITPSDDWPHIYLRSKRIPREYILGLGSIALFAVVLVWLYFRGTYRLDPHFFSLGAGFLLLETKNIVEFALLVGSTWIVSAAVISVILLVILLANFLVIKVPISKRGISLCYLLLAISLCLGYLWPISSWSSYDKLSAIGLAAAYLGFPIFMAGIIFAATFKDVKLGTAALSSNLLGALMGGLTEYLSLVWGIRALSLIALAFYLVSFIAFHARRG